MVIRGAAAIFVLILSVGLSGCIESKSPLLPESEAIGRPITGVYVTLGNRGTDGARTLDRWRVSQDGKRYKIQGPADDAGKMPTMTGTMHRLDDRYVLFQFQGDDSARGNYSYWLVSLRSNWILINTIDCDTSALRNAGGRGTCRDIKSRSVLTALARNATRHSLDRPKDGLLDSDVLGAALRIQN